MHLRLGLLGLSERLVEVTYGELKTMPLWDNPVLPATISDYADYSGWETIGYLDKPPQFESGDVFSGLLRVVTEMATTIVSGVMAAGSPWVYFNIPPAVWHQHYRMRREWPLIRTTTGLRKATDG